jgi:hypothetical protein
MNFTDMIIRFADNSTPSKLEEDLLREAGPGRIQGETS